MGRPGCVITDSAVEAQTQAMISHRLNLAPPPARNRAKRFRHVSFPLRRQRMTKNNILSPDSSQMACRKKCGNQKA